MIRSAKPMICNMQPFKRKFVSPCSRLQSPERMNDGDEGSGREGTVVAFCR